jgi:rubrerythrin
MWKQEAMLGSLLSEEEPLYEDEAEEAFYEEVELVVEDPVFEILGDMYVCSDCGYPLTEIPTYNRFYCENCGLHY